MAEWPSSLQHVLGQTRPLALRHIYRHHDLTSHPILTILELRVIRIIRYLRYQRYLRDHDLLILPSNHLLRSVITPITNITTDIDSWW